VIKAKPVVIDTNVLISSVLSPEGVPARVVRHFICHASIVFSEETYEEFYTRLWRPKFDRYISREMRKTLLLDFSNIAHWVDISGELELCRDPDDNKFLEVAIKANASLLISGDDDLTSLKRVENIPIVTPAQCLELLSNDV
jgi:putative PIN family toxin of toxin-antitoxin system